MDVVLIPAYEPDNHLIELVKELRSMDFAVLVVDDGSGNDYRDVFSQVEEMATVVTHKKNRGKGAALKTGMRYIRNNMSDADNFITCDADGQHTPADVKRVSDMLNNGHRFVLTVRNRRKDIPLRSKVGNNLSRFVYALLTNRYLPDNQSGLRGFSCSHIDWLIEVEKNNYDYEMNVLYYAAKKGVRITTLEIEAIYLDNNQSSHFNPIADTVRIYRSLFYLARGTFIAFFISELLVLALSFTLGYKYLGITLPSVTALALLINTLINKFWVFRKTRYTDYLNTLIYMVIHYFFYTLGCMLFMFAWESCPLFIAFNICFIVGIPLRFFLHKFIYIASRTKE